jgi:hypothetical protein
MARTNDSIVYAESKLAICRKLGSTEWEVRGPNGFSVTKEPTDKGGSRTVLVRNDGEGAVLETTSNGAKARLAAVKHSLALGLITEEVAAARIVALTPAKKA